MHKFTKKKSTIGEISFEKFDILKNAKHMIIQ